MKIEGFLFGKPGKSKERHREILVPAKEIRRKSLTVGWKLCKHRSNFISMVVELGLTQSDKQAARILSWRAPE